MKTDHDHGSHGMPGIYIKYDVSALKVHVLLGRENIIKMAIRMCSVISGIIVISGFINSLLLKCWEKLSRLQSMKLVKKSYR
jgi:endoplasmic reticulum-Golgi intermediate compartment protein 2